MNQKLAELLLITVDLKWSPWELISAIDRQAGEAGSVQAGVPHSESQHYHRISAHSAQWKEAHEIGGKINVEMMMNLFLRGL